MRYDPSVALIVVDVQNDFSHPNGSLFVSGAPGVVTAVTLESQAARVAGALVVYTQDWHPPHTPHFQIDGGIWPVHCVRDTWGAAFDDALVVAGPVIRKGEAGEDGYSGFTVRDPATGTLQPTRLAALLRAHAIERAVVVGLATDYCVRATALDSVTAGFATTVVRAAVASVDLEPGDGDRALAEMAAAGVTCV